MVHNMKVTINTGKKMVTANFYGQINLHIVVISLIIIFMVKEDTDGLTVVNIVVIGNVIKCMVMEYSRGPMAENTTDNIMMIKNKVTVYLRGRMDVSMMDIG